jgi:hypothetical protein
MTAKKNYNQSALMSAYNYGKSWARRTGIATTDRVDRAFGYLMSGNAEGKWEEYQTTTESCQCPDHQYRSVFCKHIMSFLINAKHDEIMIDEGYWMEAA